MAQKKRVTTMAERLRALDGLDGKPVNAQQLKLEEAFDELLRQMLRAGWTPAELWARYRRSLEDQAGFHRDAASHMSLEELERAAKRERLRAVQATRIALGPPGEARGTTFGTPLD